MAAGRMAIAAMCQQPATAAASATAALRHMNSDARKVQREGQEEEKTGSPSNVRLGPCFACRCQSLCLPLSHSFSRYLYLWKVWQEKIEKRTGGM